MISLAQTQLTAQLADVSANSAGALTLAGIDATLIGVAIAGEGQLGQNYRIVLVGLLLSTLTFLLGTQTGTRRREPTLGPRPSAFYERFGGTASDGFQLQLLADLSAAFDANARILQVQVARILRAALLMTAMLVYAVFLALSSAHGAKPDSHGPNGQHAGPGPARLHTWWPGHVAHQPHPGFRCPWRARCHSERAGACDCGQHATRAKQPCQPRSGLASHRPGT
jgi:hypothetical protein